MTTVPLQQLFVLNSEFMVQNAKALAARLATSDKDDAGRIRAAFLLLYGRPATEQDVKLGLAFLTAKDASKAGQETDALGAVCPGVVGANEFMYVD